jgi:HEAT repeat protein
MLSMLSTIPDPEVQRAVATALGEWGGEEAARAISDVLRSLPDEELQLYCVGALRTIGGPAAVEGLRDAILTGTDAVQDAAISAIAELAVGGAKEDTEDPLAVEVPPHEEQTYGRVRTRGAVRTQRVPEPVVRDVVDALDRVRQDAAASDYVRLRARQVLGYLSKVMSSRAEAAWTPVPEYFRSGTPLLSRNSDYRAECLG